MDLRIDKLLTAWFGPPPTTQADVEACLSKWFRADPDADRDLEARFGTLAAAAANGELEDWRATPRSRLALILLFDQLPRQLHRGTAAAFAGDDRALELTLTGIEHGMDLELAPLERAFFYTPMEHSESLPIQELGVLKFAALAGDPDAPEMLRGTLQTFAKFAREHRDIVARFGRFPHRNRVFGRENTPEEAAWLGGGGPTFGQ